MAFGCDDDVPEWVSIFGISRFSNGSLELNPGG